VCIEPVVIESSPTGPVCFGDTPAAQKAEPVRIVIVDAHPIFRDGLRRLLETVPGLSTVGAVNPIDMVALVDALKPDLLLLGLTAGSAIDVLEPMLQRHETMRTIILTRSIESPDALRALGLGARGLIPKDSSADALFAAIASVMAGGVWIGSEGGSTRPQAVFGLTAREIEIVRAVMSGDTNREISAKFSISENTVKRHLTHIFNKVGASTRVELALFAAHHGLLAD
jgi:two-component system nitrate/nitrite response regulator NarL